MKHFVAAVLCACSLVLTGSAAGAIRPPITGVTDPIRSTSPHPPGLRTLSSTNLVGGLLGPVPAVGPLTPAEAGNGQPAVSPFASLPSGAFAGYGAGTAYHSDAALAGKDRPADIDAAFAAASFSSAALPARADELGRSLAPDLKASRGYGRASSLDYSLAGQKDEIDSQADAEAPPGRGVTVKEPVPEVKLPPVFNADSLKSQASARSAADGCVLGGDLAYGLAAADNTQFLDTKQKKDDPRRPIVSLSSDDPARAMTQTVSRTKIIPPGVGGATNFGLLAEVRQTIAPVSFQAGDQQFTVEVGGEWVLRAFTDGVTGKLTFGPDDSSGGTPLLRVIDSEGHVVDEQDLAELTGKQAITGGGVTLFLGEDPRAIGSVGEDVQKPIISGSVVAAAMDVVRLQALDAENNPVQLRIGHMEVAITVPPSGVPCPGISLVKQLDRGVVRPLDKFSWTVTVANPNDCLLDGIKLQDTISASDGLQYRIVATAPPSRLVRNGVLAFEGLEPLHGGQSRSIRIDVEVAPGSSPGRFSDLATAGGTCRPDPVPGEDDTSIGVGVAAPASVVREGSVSLDGPVVEAQPPTAGGPPPALPTVPLVSSNVPAAPARGSDTTRTAASGAILGSPAPAQATVKSPPASRSGPLAATGGVTLIPGVALVAGGWLLRRWGRRRRACSIT